MTKLTIHYDLQKDIGNRYDACCSVYQGIDRKQGIDSQIYQNIISNDQDQAELYLSGYIKSSHQVRINQYLLQLENDLELVESEKYLNRLENEIGYKIQFNTIKLFVTSFPRCTYDSVGGSLMCYYKTSQPIHAVLHETLHFVFHHYFSNLILENIITTEEFHLLKEAQTIILNEIFKDLFEKLRIVDGDYDEHVQLRQLLLIHWLEFHNFDSMIQYGISLIKQ